MSLVAHASFGNQADAPPLRLLLIDDSAVMRSVLARMFADHPRLHVAGLVPGVAGAHAFLQRESADIILLDHEMPGRTGLDALPELLAAGRGAHVVMLSGHGAAGGAVAVQALAAGASDVILKPCVSQYAREFEQTLIGRLLRLGARRTAAAIQERVPLRPAPNNFQPRCLAIGASTGGIPALRALFSTREGRYSLPVLVTQHLPESFLPHFVTQLGRIAGMPASLARDGEPLRDNHIHVAPGHAHLLLAPDGRGAVRVRLDAAERVKGRSLPAVDPMFAAVAQVYGDGALAIVLTGMGRDGAEGARAIVEAGGLVLAQDAPSSVVWGMPGAVARAGLASALLRPEEMAGFVYALTGQNG